MPDGTEGFRSMQPFAPGPETARAYRDALGCFGTGVTVVTCRTETGPLAMTANSFASVSLDPPLVLWSPAVASSRHDAFVAAQRFSIHVLGGDQRDLARDCAMNGRVFDEALWHTEGTAAPTLRQCLVRFDCLHHAALGAGDHTVVLGRVERVMPGAGAPLLFVQGRDGGFTSGG